MPRSATIAGGILGLLTGLAQAAKQNRQQKQAEELALLQLVGSQEGNTITPAQPGSVQPTSPFSRFLGAGQYTAGPGGAPVASLGGVPLTVQKIPTFGESLFDQQGQETPVPRQKPIEAPQLPQTTQTTEATPAPETEVENVGASFRLLPQEQRELDNLNAMYRNQPMTADAYRQYQKDRAAIYKEARTRYNMDQRAAQTRQRQEEAEQRRVEREAAREERRRKQELADRAENRQYESGVRKERYGREDVREQRKVATQQADRIRKNETQLAELERPVAGNTFDLPDGSTFKFGGKADMPEETKNRLKRTLLTQIMTDANALLDSPQHQAYAREALSRASRMLAEIPEETEPVVQPGGGNIKVKSFTQVP